MCGIVGVVDLDHGIDLDNLCAATAALSHRGPDDGAYLLARLDGDEPVIVGHSGKNDTERLTEAAATLGPPHVAFGFRRLAIIEPGNGGRQPMASPDRRCWIANNGEIYNYRELRKKLEQAGVTFSSRSDTEVLLRIIDLNGTSALRDVVGMFAFAFLNLRSRTLLLARDPFGIKPLYVTSCLNRLAFASEIPALIEFPWVSRTIDPASMRDYLSLGITNHRADTLFASIKEVRPSHVLHIELRARLHRVESRYSHVGAKHSANLSLTEAVERTRSLFFESIALHLRSDVPITVSLSGGIDSSAIVAATRRLIGPKQQIQTFGYVPFMDGRRNEEQWMDIVAADVAAQHTKVRLDSRTLIKDVDRLIRLQGEPFGGPSILAQLHLYRTIKNHGFKVVLDGQGADELFAGYDSALGARLASLVRQRRWMSAIRFVNALASWPDTSAAAVVKDAIRLVPSSAARRLLAYLHQPRTVVPFGWKPWFDERCDRPLRMSVPNGADVLHSVLRTQIQAVDLPLLLRIADRNAMAFSLENRVPFLVPALANLLLSLDEEFLLGPDGTRKRVFRQAMRGIVPDPILNRRDKVGFASVEPVWLSALVPWVDAAIHCDTTRALPFVCHQELVTAWNGVRFQASLGLVAQTFGIIWRWANLVRWAEVFGVRLAG